LRNRPRAPSWSSCPALPALAAAGNALTVDRLAEALTWTLERTRTALDHAIAHPHLGGPLILRRVPPHGYTVKPRPDRLTSDQYRAVTTAGRATVLSVEQANALLAVIALVPRTTYADTRDIYTTWKAEHEDAEQAIREAGLIHNPDNHQRPQAEPEVLYSLRYDRAGNQPPAPPSD
jgi:hypothetical protein